MPPTRSADPPSPSNTVGSDQVCNISDLLHSDNLLNRPLKRIVFYDLSPLDALFDSQIMVQFFIFVHLKIKWSIHLYLRILFVLMFFLQEKTISIRFKFLSSSNLNFNFVDYTNILVIYLNHR